MTQPLRLPRSGDEREDRAIAIAAAVAAIFGAAEAALIASIAAAVRKALSSGITSVTPQQISAIVGYTLALAERRAMQAVTSAGLHPVPRRVTDALESASARAYGSALAAYREALAVAQAEPGPRSLSILRLQAAQRALDQLAASGITGLTDRAGRNWDLASYVEMATRTGVSNAYDDLTAGALASRGLDLVLVTHGMEPACGNCAPYLGKLLSLTGDTPPGMYSVEDSTGRFRTANVVATVATAKANGWRHPSCRCGTIPWEDGSDMSAADFVPSAQSMARRYAAEQDMRGRQRAARRAARRQQAAITPQARTRARRDVLATRSALTRHGRRMGHPAA